MGYADGDAARFLREGYQASVVHVRRLSAPSHFEDHVLSRGEVRAALDALSWRGFASLFVLSNAAAARNGPIARRARSRGHGHAC